MGTTLDYILTIAALVIGVLLLMGKGEFFLKGGNADFRKKFYDEKKMEKASGIALVLIGSATGIDIFTTSPAAKIAYIIAIIVIFVGFVYYLKVKCKK